MRLRWMLVRLLGAGLVLGAVGLVVAIVLASVFGLPSIATALQQWGFWLLWGPIALGLVWGAIRGRPRAKRGAPPLGAQSEVNDLYLGRRPSSSPTKTVSSYSAYPPENGGTDK